jgi:hypothetical protein
MHVIKRAKLVVVSSGKRQRIRCPSGSGRLYRTIKKGALKTSLNPRRLSTHADIVADCVVLMSEQQIPRRDKNLFHRTDAFDQICDDAHKEYDKTPGKRIARRALSHFIILKGKFFRQARI